MPVSPQDWEKIKQAAIAGVPSMELVDLFPDLTFAALRKRAAREDWPTPKRIQYLQGHIDPNAPPVAPTSHTAFIAQNLPKTETKGDKSEGISATAITIESTKGGANACLGNLALRTIKKVDNWDIPDPRDIKEGLSLANFLMRLHQPAPQHLSQVNMQFVSPWGTASGAKFLEVETPEEP